MKSLKGDILNINPSSEMDNARNVSFGHSVDKTNLFDIHIC